MWKKNFKNGPCARGINFLSRSTNSRILIFCSQYTFGTVSDVRGVKEVYGFANNRPSRSPLPFPPPLFRRGRSPRNVTVHRANLLCKLADVFSIPQRKQRPGTVDKKKKKKKNASHRDGRTKCPSCEE